MTEKKKEEFEKEFDVEIEFRLYSYAESRRKETVNDGDLALRNPDEIKWYTGQEHSVTLPDKFSSHAQIRSWCLKNCHGPVAFIIHDGYWQTEEQLYFFFAEDAMACKLRWT